jgi:broad specificity phosphatase PhoE
MAELAQNQHDSTPDLAQANVNRATGGAEFSGTGPALEAYARSIANSVYTWQSSGAGDSDAFAGGDGAAYASALTETNRAFVQALGDVEAQRVRADAVEVKAYELQYNAARRVRDDAVSAARRAFAESQAESLFDHVASDPRFMEPVAGSWEGELTGSVSTPWHAHFARLAEAEYELVIGRAPGESLEPWEQSDGQAARTELFEQAVHAQQKTYADTVAGARQTYAGSRIDELIGERVDAVADVPAVAGEWPAPALLALPSGPWEPAAIDVALFDGDSPWSGLDWTQQGYASEFSLRHGEFLQSASGEYRDEYGSSLGFYDLSTRSIGDRSLSYDPTDPASVLGSVTDQASWSGQTWTGPSAWGGADSAWSGPDSSWWTFSTDDLPGLFSTLTTAGTSLDSTTLTGTGSASAGTYDTEGYDAITADGTTGDGSADGSTSAGSGGPSDGSSSTGTTTVGAPLEGTDQLSSELGGEGTQGQYPLQPAEGPRPDGLKPEKLPPAPFIVRFSTPADDDSLLQFHVPWVATVPIGRVERLNSVWAPNGHIFVVERDGRYARLEDVKLALQRAQLNRTVLDARFWDSFFEKHGVPASEKQTLLPPPPSDAEINAMLPPRARYGQPPELTAPNPQLARDNQPEKPTLGRIPVQIEPSYWEKLKTIGAEGRAVPETIFIYYDASGPNAALNKDFAEIEAIDRGRRLQFAAILEDVDAVAEGYQTGASIVFDAADNVIAVVKAGKSILEDPSVQNVIRQGMVVTVVVATVGSSRLVPDDVPAPKGGWIGGLPRAHSLTNRQTRNWYVDNVKAIGAQVDTSRTLREQALQAFQRRTEVRQMARDLMSDRALAESLPPMRSLQDIVKRKYDRGLVGDDLWRDVLRSAQTPDPNVNALFGIH